MMAYQMFNFSSSSRNDTELRAFLATERALSTSAACSRAQEKLPRKPVPPKKKTANLTKIKKMVQKEKEQAKKTIQAIEKMKDQVKMKEKKAIEALNKLEAKIKKEKEKKVAVKKVKAAKKVVRERVLEKEIIIEREREYDFMGNNYYYRI